MRKLGKKGTFNSSLKDTYLTSLNLDGFAEKGNFQFLIKGYLCIIPLLKRRRKSFNSSLKDTLELENDTEAMGRSFNSSLKDTRVPKQRKIYRGIFQFLIKGYMSGKKAAVLVFAFNSSLKDTHVQRPQSPRVLQHLSIPH